MITEKRKKKNPKHKSQVWLVRKSNEAIEVNENFKFTYADMHGILKIVLNKPLNIKYVKHFRS